MTVLVLSAHDDDTATRVADAELKMAQIQTAAQLGLAVPPTLVTSIGSEARAFARQLTGQTA